jgi:hypothetical protein
MTTLSLLVKADYANNSCGPQNNPMYNLKTFDSVCDLTMDNFAITAFKDRCLGQKVCSFEWAAISDLFPPECDATFASPD